jgi:hypothetical protein
MRTHRLLVKMPLFALYIYYEKYSRQTIATYVLVRVILPNQEGPSTLIKRFQMVSNGFKWVLSGSLFRCVTTATDPTRDIKTCWAKRLQRVIPSNRLKEAIPTALKDGWAQIMAAVWDEVPCQPVPKEDIIRKGAVCFGRVNKLHEGKESEDDDLYDSSKEDFDRVEESEL